MIWVAPMDGGVAAAEPDADRKLDLMTANYGGGNVSVMLGVGNGTFSVATNYAVGPQPLGVAAGDVNSDGHADIVATDSNNSVVWVLAGTGTGTFAAGVTYATGISPTDVVIVDATGDGRADILTANAVGTASLLRQQTNGTLAAKVDIAVGMTPFALTVADMDQDGIADLVTANQFAESVSVLKGLGGGSFSAKSEYSVQQQTGIYRPFAVTTGDLNGDGNADVVVGNWLDYTYGTGNWNVSVLLRNTPSVENFRYDAGGTRTGAGSGGAYVAGDHNELDADGKYTYQYDRLGNLATRTETATGKVTEYAWDNHNRLTKVTYRASAGGTITGTAEYAYDMNGRRIRRKVDLDGQAGFEIDERFVYDGDYLALVFDAAGTLTNRYLSADAVDAALAEDDFSTSGIANATEWLLADHQGSVRDIVRETGAEITHVTYDSFGNITGVTGSMPVAPRIGYTGQERDPETGLLYYGARYYDPRTGRFISQDPTGFGAGDPNLYRYVHNSPVIYVDPTGLSRATPKQDVLTGIASLFVPAISGLAQVGRAISGLIPEFDFTTRTTTSNPSGRTAQTTTSIGWRNGSPYFEQGTSLQTYVGMNESSTLLSGSPEFRNSAPAAVSDIHINDIIGAWNKPTAAPSQTGSAIGGLLGAAWESAGEAWPGIKDYARRSAEQVIYGDYSNEVTALGTGTQVMTGLLGVDAPADIRDVSANIWNWEWSWSHVGKTAMNAAAILPVVGMLKYGDEVAATTRGYSSIEASARATSAYNPAFENVVVDAVANPRSFRSFSELKRELGPAGEGMVWHHIVEQSQEGRFGAQAIHNTANIMPISAEANTRLNALYSSIRPTITGSDRLTVREWLRTKSYAEASRFGQEAAARVQRGDWP